MPAAEGAAITERPPVLAALASGLSGVYIQPPDQVVAPPKPSAFSTTLSPCQAAVPAAPDPTTTNSSTNAAC